MVTLRNVRKTQSSWRSPTFDFIAEHPENAAISKTRKRCDLRSRPQKSQRFFISESLGTFDLSLLFRRQKKHFDLEFAISRRSDLRFHSAILLRFSEEPAARVAILNLRFENAAIAIVWDSLCALHGLQFIELICGANLRISLPEGGWEYE